MSFIVKLQSFAARMQTRGVGRVRVAGALVLILASIPSAPCRAENPENVLDHFLCYTLDPEPKFTPPTARIQVTDEIGKKTVKVQDRAFLCNPVTKTHGAKTFPQIHSNAHLVCYDVEPTSAGKDVLIINQFSTDPQYPRKLTLVTPGDPVDDRTEGETRTTRRRTSVPIRFAGFNLGDYERAVASIPGFNVEVYGNRRLEPALQAKPAGLAEAPTRPLTAQQRREAMSAQIPPAQPDPLARPLHAAVGELDRDLHVAP